MSDTTRFEPRRLLVTGGAGFIGSHLVEWILQRAPSVERLVVLDRLTYAGHRLNLRAVEPDSRLVFVHGDVCDAALVGRLFDEHRFDAVFHLAAESHVDRSIENAADFVRTNVLGTFTLLDQARRAWSAQRARFVHVSTDEVYGELGDTGSFTEESPYRPNSPYAASKAGADHLVRAYRRTYGLPVVVTNCSNNYGPRQMPEKLIPLMVDRALRGEPLPVYGEGRQVRDWLHVEDHCEGLWRAMTLGQDGERYHFGAGVELTNLALVQRLADEVDRQMGRAEGTSRALIRFVRDRPGHDFRYAIDWSKSHAELAWSPRRSFDEGLRDTVRWYVENRGWVEAVRSEEHERFVRAQYEGR